MDLKISSLQEARKAEKILRRCHKETQMALREQLARKLPSFLMPGNIGGYNKVTWPFWTVVDFDFGTDPVYGPTTRQSRQFRVSQDGAFLLQAITRNSFSYDTAGELAALQLKFIDRQSTRQLNDLPLPIQAIGHKSKPAIFPTPYLLMPSALFEVELSSWLPADQATTGNGRHQFVFFGYRVRVEDFENVLSTVVG